MRSSQISQISEMFLDASIFASGGEGEDAFLHLKLITLMVSHVR